MNNQVTERALLLRIATVSLIASLSTGCGYLLHARDSSTPLAVPAMRQAQMLNPEAGRNRKVVAGLDGTASKNVSEAYSSSFERQAETDSTAGFQGMEGLSTN